MDSTMIQEFPHTWAWWGEALLRHCVPPGPCGFPDTSPHWGQGRARQKNRQAGRGLHNAL